MITFPVSSGNAHRDRVKEAEAKPQEERDEAARSVLSTSDNREGAAVAQVTVGEAKEYTLEAELD